MRLDRIRRIQNGLALFRTFRSPHTWPCCQAECCRFSILEGWQLRFWVNLRRNCCMKIVSWLGSIRRRFSSSHFSAIKRFRKHPRPTRLITERLDERMMLSVVPWDGGGCDFSWNNPISWSTDALPGPNDDVVIDVPADISVTLAAGNTTIKSLRSQESFTLASGTLAIKGDSLVTGTLTIGPGAILAADTAAGTFAATGITQIDGGSIRATGGAVISLPFATAYDQASTNSFQRRTIRADGSGSRVDLSGLTSITNGWNFDAGLAIEALAGGVVDLRSVQQIVDPSTGDLRHRSIDVTANGAGSTVRLDALASFSDALGNASGNVDGRWSTLAALSGGVITAPNLTTLIGVDANQGAASLLPIGALSTLTSGRFSVDSADITLGALSSIDGSNFIVTGGGRIALPAVTNYNQASTDSFQSRTFRADGTGSRLQINNLAAISNGTNYDAHLFIQAAAGGEVALNGLTRITDPTSGDTRHRSIEISADGAASIIRLNSLDTFTDSFATASGNVDGRWSVLVATNGRSITAPNLATLRGIDLSVDATSSIP